MAINAVVNIHIDFNDGETYDLAGTFEMELITDWYRYYSAVIPVTISYYPEYNETDSAIELYLEEVHSGYYSYWSQLVEDETNVVTFNDPIAGILPAGPENGTASGSVSITGYLTAVPDIVGLTRAAAETALLNAQLYAGAVTEEYSETVEEGLVISQSLPAGTEVEAGVPISFVISLGISEAPPKAENPTPSDAGTDISRVLYRLSWEVPEE